MNEEGQSHERSIEPCANLTNHMNDILNWVSEYSPPIVFLILVGTIFIYLIKLLTEKAVANGFDRVKKMTELILEKRSNFEERVLLDIYNITISIQTKIASTATNINRMRSGHTVDNFIANDELVPLTEVYETLANNMFLLPPVIHKVLKDQADVVLKLCNETDPDKVSALKHEYERNIKSFAAVMNDVFKLTQIKW